MTNAQKDFYRGLAYSMLRKLMAIIGTFLVTHGWISTEQADGLTTLAVVEFVFSFLLLFGSSIWTWAKERFNSEVKREARSADVDTPIGVINSDTVEKSKATFISAV